jgi:ATP phosphoribosyltransferase
VAVSAPLRIGLPKGRILDDAEGLFRAAGVDLTPLKADKRRLIHPLMAEGLGPVEVLVLRASDVAAYVEHGACAVGVVGNDTLEEQQADVLWPLDLGIGRCRMCVAGLAGADPFALEQPRVATKYGRVAKAHFSARGLDARIIQLSGAIELAPLVGLADAIVDIVETGETLRQNGLVVHEPIFEVSARLVVNRAALRLQMGPVRGLLDRLEAAVAARGGA